ncbi:hypothetical protein PLICRDRAFT_95677 [Plicaturopsis crispa FD-325 SS-3]|uniref:Na+/solute symporter n=1 Tax=Plicaturopsis crispa FD-325 SS-3 TaxID=944288 RepID=A0A0C9SWY1_PLICR|nr:hypothetical protein PLICRDRAFT_95677 [Plicaturopsis crispa FD-325 SS-3]
MSLLPQSAGYAVILGGGVFFAVFINALTWVQRNYTRYNPNRADEFSSASRSIKPGLLTVGIVSAWTWAAVFLQTGTLVYTYGISCAWWFGCGGFIEIAAFAYTSTQVKVKAGGASTFLQVAKVRFGALGHFTFMFAALLANFVISSEILVGGAGVIAGLTDVPTYAAVWLLPFVIVLYVLTGGLRATFAADYLHCVVLFVCLLVLVLSTYVRGDALGSPGHLWELLTEAAVRAPVVGNQDGSYLTFNSRGGMLYILIATFNNYGLSFLDQSYWQRAIAAKPAGTARAFLLAGISFFAIAFGIGSSLGLAARALETSPAFPTYPALMSAAEVGAGLAGPYASVAILGKAGAVMFLLIAFMATTSAFSAQLVAVSTIVSYDVYKEYFNRNATNKQLMWVNHATVIFWAVFMSGFSSVWVHIGLDLNFLFYIMGVATSGAVIPVALTMSWSKLNKVGAVAGVIGGIVLGLVVWFVAAIKLQGAITIVTLIDNQVILAAGVTALGSGGAIAVISSLIRPASFDFDLTRHIGFAGPAAVSSDSNTSFGDADRKVAPAEPSLAQEEKKGSAVDNSANAGASPFDSREEHEGEILALKKSWNTILGLTAAFLFVIYVLIPVPIAASHTIYNKPLFTLQAVAATTWVFIAIGIVVIWPILESRADLAALFRRISRRERVSVAADGL